MTGKSVKQTPSPVSATPREMTSQPRGMQTTAQPARIRVPQRAVRFGMDVSGARNVSVVGTFNRWAPGATPLRCVGGLKWFTYVSLPLGRHEYRFVVDGKWVDDPKAKAYVPNSQGGRNAVLEVIKRCSEL